MKDLKDFLLVLTLMYVHGVLALARLIQRGVNKLTNHGDRMLRGCRKELGI